MRIPSLAGAALAVAVCLLGPLPALAQQSGPDPVAQDGRPAPELPAPSTPPEPEPQRQPAPPPEPAAPGADAPPDEPAAQPDVIPFPSLSELPRGPAPPAAVIGVLAVPDVMRDSLAAQQAQRVLGARQEKLRADAQVEQEAWRALQQALESQRGKLSAAQIRTQERGLQERVATGQRRLQARARALQQANQVTLGQIQQTLIAVIQQVAASRGVNLVLQRGEIALNVNEFDITGEVAAQMNKVLPSIVVPPDDAAPSVARQPGAPSERPSATAPTRTAPGQPRR